jgi:hypothetical protein
MGTCDPPVVGPAGVGAEYSRRPGRRITWQGEAQPHILEVSHMATFGFSSSPQTAANKTEVKYLTAKETIGDAECRIVLKQDSSGQFREVELTPIGTASKERSDKSTHTDKSYVDAFK